MNNYCLHEPDSLMMHLMRHGNMWIQFSDSWLTNQETLFCCSWAFFSYCVINIEQWRNGGVKRILWYNFNLLNQRCRAIVWLWRNHFPLSHDSHASKISRAPFALELRNVTSRMLAPKYQKVVKLIKKAIDEPFIQFCFASSDGRVVWYKRKQNENP
jgi:hypothetical protein